MLITTQNEIQALMPTARWDKPQVLFGYLEEEEAVALEPLLGNKLYQHVLTEYDRLRQEYVDITATTVRPTGKAKQDPRLAHADVTERLEQVAQGKYREAYTVPEEGEKKVPAKDMKTIQLIRICQRIEWYRMLANKAGLLTISFNEGGGMNISSGESYDPADEKAKDRAVMDALGGAGRAVDSLLLFLEADAKGEKLFAEMWQDADAFYLNKDLLFQTATVLDKFIDIRKQRSVYVSLVRDIRFCQDTYLEPRIGARLLEAVVDFANNGGDSTVMKTLLKKLRIALAFYVESRRTNISRLSLTVSTSARGTGSSIEKEERLARRDSMTDAQQAMAMACDYIAENLEALGDAAVGTPIYNSAREREAQAEQARANAQAAECRRRKAACEQSRKRLFTAFPATHRTPEIK